MPRKKAPSFEEALSELENIVNQMENGDTSLAVLMEQYTKGVALSKACLAELDRAEQSMDLMVKDTGAGVETLELKIEGE